MARTFRSFRNYSKMTKNEKIRLLLFFIPLIVFTAVGVVGSAYNLIFFPWDKEVLVDCLWLMIGCPVAGFVLGATLAK